MQHPKVSLSAMTLAFALYCSITAITCLRVAAEEPEQPPFALAVLEIGEKKLNDYARRSGYTADGRLIVDDSSRLQIFDDTTGAPLARFASGQRWPSDVSLVTPNGRDAIVAPGYPGGIIFWDTANGTLLWRAQADPLRIKNAVFASASPSSKQAVFVTPDESFFLDLENRTRGAALAWPAVDAGVESEITTCVWSADEQRIWIAANRDNSTGCSGCFSVTTGKLNYGFTDNNDLNIEKISAFDVSEAAQLAYVAYNDAQLSMIADLRSGKFIQAVEVDESAHFSEDGKWLVGVTGVFDIKAGKRIREFPSAPLARVSPSRSQLALLNKDRLKIIDVRTGLLLREIRIKSDAPIMAAKLCWHPGEQRLALSHDNKFTLSVVDLRCEPIPVTNALNVGNLDDVVHSLQQNSLNGRQCSIQQIEAKPDESLPVLKKILSGKDPGISAECRRMAALAVEEMAANLGNATEIENFLVESALQLPEESAGIVHDAASRLRALNKAKKLREMLAMPHPMPKPVEAPKVVPSTNVDF
jgi:hypothetical protein